MTEGIKKHIKSNQDYVEKKTSIWIKQKERTPKTVCLPTEPWGKQSYIQTVEADVEIEGRPGLPRK